MSKSGTDGLAGIYLGGDELGNGAYRYVGIDRDIPDGIEIESLVQCCVDSVYIIDARCWP
jgi:hypothetical protein